MKKIPLFIITSIFFICIGSFSRAVAEKAYSECSVKNLTEDDYSEWVPMTDMQLSFNNRPRGTYWVHMEGRNLHGLTQFRWVQRDWNQSEYINWRHRSNITLEKFFEEGIKMRNDGYKRTSLQVFVDGAGIPRYQVLWAKPTPDNMKETSYKVTLSDLSTEEKTIREEVFSEWLPTQEHQVKFDANVKDKMFPILPEADANYNKRSIFVKRNFGFYTRSAQQFPKFIKYNTEYMEKGFSLLTLTKCEKENGIALFSATWVKKEDLEQAVSKLEKFGIKQAEITKNLNTSK